MNTNKEAIIGIVGGMGPQAGQLLFDRIIRYTGAGTDQEHLSVALLSFPKNIVDRTAFLDGDTDVNPAWNIAGIIGMLERTGATIIGIPCNTSHTRPIYEVILQELRRMNSRVRLVNMAVETCDDIAREYPGAKRIGVMATNGTYRSGLYTELLSQRGYEVVVPGAGFQQEVIHRMIYGPGFGLKSHPNGLTKEALDLYITALHFFRKNSADAVVLGCTELSLMKPEAYMATFPTIDTIDVLARALIRETTDLQPRRRHDETQQITQIRP